MAKIILCVLHLLLVFSAILTIISETSSASESQQNINIVKSLPGYHGDLPFKLETGYIGVGDSDQVQLFYYFVESERDAKRDPLLVWLTGGPGCSAFSGLVYEIGPLQFNYTAFTSDPDLPTFELNPYSWTKVASIIFLDSPVGTGFSYALTSEAYHSNDSLQSAHIYEFLRKWFVDHPMFLGNPFYVSGDSYGGKIVPIVVQNILDGNEMKLKPKINLQGYSIGNGVMTTRSSKSAELEYAYRVSLISDELYKLAKKSCGDYMHDDSNSPNCLKASRAVSKDTTLINDPHILEPKCVYVAPKPKKRSSTSNNQFVDPILFESGIQSPQGWCRAQHYVLSYTWANNVRVREALHIREGTVDYWLRCNRSLSYSFDVPDSVGYQQNFTRKFIRALVYSGDQDLSIPHTDSLEWINKLDIPIDNGWRPWFVAGQVAGYVTAYSNKLYHLTFTTIKGGGHTAPEYRPKECLAMIDRWLALRYL